MIQYRRLTALLLGAWLGAGVFADVAVTQNFQTVDRFLAQPGSLHTAGELSQIGKDRERAILRRNAGEENNAIFENWERVELVAGCTLLALLLYGSKPHKWMLAGALLMVVIVVAQHFLLSPRIADLGRRLAELSDDDPLILKFWTFHDMYSGSEILKLLVGFVLAVWMALRRRQDPDHFAKTIDADAAAAGSRGNQAGQIG